RQGLRRWWHPGLRGHRPRGRAQGPGRAGRGPDGMSSGMNDRLPFPQAAAAATVLARLRSLFDEAVLALGQGCLQNGRLNARKLDERQVASFEMAWAGAELLAAETAVAALAPDSDGVDARLALVFAADAVVSLLDRLDVMLAEA